MIIWGTLLIIVGTLPLTSGKIPIQTNRPLWQVCTILHHIASYFNCLKKIGGHKFFLWGHWYPCFGLLLTSALGLKARVDCLLFFSPAGNGFLLFSSYLFTIVGTLPLASGRLAFYWGNTTYHIGETCLPLFTHWLIISQDFLYNC